VAKGETVNKAEGVHVAIKHAKRYNLKTVT